MSELAYLAIAVAINPRLTESLRRDVAGTVQNLGLQLGSAEIEKLQRLVSSGGEGMGPPPIGPVGPGRVNVLFPAAACRAVSNKIRLNAFERQQFQTDPVGYLKKNGINIPPEMVPSSEEVGSLLGQGSERVDPTSVAVAV